MRQTDRQTDRRRGFKRMTIHKRVRGEGERERECGRQRLRKEGSGGYRTH